jgi:hypothetical protein
MKTTLVWQGPAEIAPADGWILADAEGQQQITLSAVTFNAYTCT